MDDDAHPSLRDGGRSLMNNSKAAALSSSGPAACGIEVDGGGNGGGVLAGLLSASSLSLSAPRRRLAATPLPSTTANASATATCNGSVHAHSQSDGVRGGGGAGGAGGGEGKGGNGAPTMMRPLGRSAVVYGANAMRWGRSNRRSAAASAVLLLIAFLLLALTMAGGRGLVATTAAPPSVAPPLSTPQQRRGKEERRQHQHRDGDYNAHEDDADADDEATLIFNSIDPQTPDPKTANPYDRPEDADRLAANGSIWHALIAGPTGRIGAEMGMEGEETEDDAWWGNGAKGGPFGGFRNAPLSVITDGARPALCLMSAMYSGNCRWLEESLEGCIRRAGGFGGGGGLSAAGSGSGSGGNVRTAAARFEDSVSDMCRKSAYWRALRRRLDAEEEKEREIASAAIRRRRTRREEMEEEEEGEELLAETLGDRGSEVPFTTRHPTTRHPTTVMRRSSPFALSKGQVFDAEVCSKTRQSPPFVAPADRTLPPMGPPRLCRNRFHVGPHSSSSSFSFSSGGHINGRSDSSGGGGGVPQFPIHFSTPSINIHTRLFPKLWDIAPIVLDAPPPPPPSPSSSMADNDRHRREDDSLRKQKNRKQRRASLNSNSSSSSSPRSRPRPPLPPPLPPPPPPQKYFGRDDEDMMRTVYAMSYFCLSHARGGWDCLRHTEAMGAGCILLFYDVAAAGPFVLPHLPKRFLSRVARLPIFSHLGFVSGADVDNPERFVLSSPRHPNKAVEAQHNQRQRTIVGEPTASPFFLPSTFVADLHHRLWRGLSRFRQWVSARTGSLRRTLSDSLALSSLTSMAYVSSDPKDMFAESTSTASSPDDADVSGSTSSATSSVALRPVVFAAVQNGRTRVVFQREPYQFYGTFMRMRHHQQQRDSFEGYPSSPADSFSSSSSSSSSLHPTDSSTASSPLLPSDSSTYPSLNLTWYWESARRSIVFAQRYLSSEAMASYVLETMGVAASAKHVLIVSRHAHDGIHHSLVAGLAGLGIKLTIVTAIHRRLHTCIAVPDAIEASATAAAASSVAEEGVNTSQTRSDISPKRILRRKAVEYYGTHDSQIVHSESLSLRGLVQGRTAAGRDDTTYAHGIPTAHRMRSLPSDVRFVHSFSELMPMLTAEEDGGDADYSLAHDDEGEEGADPTQKSATKKKKKKTNKKSNVADDLSTVPFDAAIITYFGRRVPMQPPDDFLEVLGAYFARQRRRRVRKMRATAGGRKQRSAASQPPLPFSSSQHRQSGASVAAHDGMVVPSPAADDKGRRQRSVGGGLRYDYYKGLLGTVWGGDGDYSCAAASAPFSSLRPLPLSLSPAVHSGGGEEGSSSPSSSSSFLPFATPAARAAFTFRCACGPASVAGGTSFGGVLGGFGFGGYHCDERPPIAVIDHRDTREDPAKGSLSVADRYWFFSRELRRAHC